MRGPAPVLPGAVRRLACGGAVRVPLTQRCVRASRERGRRWDPEVQVAGVMDKFGEGKNGIATCARSGLTVLVCDITVMALRG
jgi:hypothetical protein